MSALGSGDDSAPADRSKATGHGLDGRDTQGNGDRLTRSRERLRRVLSGEQPSATPSGAPTLASPPGSLDANSGSSRGPPSPRDSSRSAPATPAWHGDRRRRASDLDAAVARAPATGLDRGNCCTFDRTSGAQDCTRSRDGDSRRRGFAGLCAETLRADRHELAASASADARSTSAKSPPLRPSASAKSQKESGSSASCTMTWGSSTSTAAASSAHQIRLMLRRYRCLRNDLLPMCPEQTLGKMVAGAGFEPATFGL